MKRNKTPAEPGAALQDKTAYKIAAAILTIQAALSLRIARRVNACSRKYQKLFLLAFLILGALTCIALPVWTFYRASTPVAITRPITTTDSMSMIKP